MAHRLPRFLNCSCGRPRSTHASAPTTSKACHASSTEAVARSASSSEAFIAIARSRLHNSNTRRIRGVRHTSFKSPPRCRVRFSAPTTTPSPNESMKSRPDKSSTTRRRPSATADTTAWRNSGAPATSRSPAALITVQGGWSRQLSNRVTVKKPYPPHVLSPSAKRHSSRMVASEENTASPIKGPTMGTSVGSM